jgi:hypothetical protein
MNAGQTKQSSQNGCGTKLNRLGVSYTLSPAGSHFVGQAVDVSRVAHEDSSLDHVDSAGRYGDSSAGNAGAGVATATESIVHNLASLFRIMSLWLLTSSSAQTRTR